MTKHLVLVGGGHAHMVTLAKLHTFVEKGYRVTVVGPSEYHYYSGMGPGMLGNTYTPEDIRFATRHVVEKQGGTFILGKATGVDPIAKTLFLESGDQITYDVISFNTGSYVPLLNLSEIKGDIYSAKPIERLLEAQRRILELSSRKKITIGIVGGGPSSAEIAGNVWQLTQDSKKIPPEIKIFSGKRFMSRFPEKVRTRVKKSLTRRGIRILSGNYAETIESKTVILASGERHDLDVIFLALGVMPNRLFKNSGLPTGPDGGLLVNAYLQSTAHPDIFGGGDCIYFEPQPLDKVGVYAVRENPVLYANLMAALDGRPLQPFDPGGDYLLIFNVGGGKGVLRKKWLLLDGKLAFFIKDAIDRKFMKEFQAIEK
ncbi:MAG: FAD-dependent oxidoreductase [Desulfobacterales bacterium]|nr:FAD-dependent oxidoreductase [Desulfobacterales bacterium]MDX2510960.1 FAD-dependent oxidoreductase [Desulfobacterales bacterium]